MIWYHKNVTDTAPKKKRILPVRANEVISISVSMKWKGACEGGFEMARVLSPMLPATI